MFPPRLTPISRILSHGRGVPALTALTALASAATVLVLSSWSFAAAVAGESFGSRKFEIGGKAFVVETLLTSEARGPRTRARRVERVSLKGVASALGGTATALDDRGSFVLELGGRSVAFSSEYPAIVKAGDRLVSLSSDARPVLGDLYLPSDFMTRVVEPLVAAPASDRADVATPEASASSSSHPAGPEVTAPAASVAVGPAVSGAAARAASGVVAPVGSAAVAPAASVAAAPAASVAVTPVASVMESTALAPSAPSTSGAESSGAPSPASSGEAVRTIVLDPGHGGDELGAAGKSGLLEKEITLDVAKRLKARLEKNPGVRVLLTRDADTKVTLDERAALANHVHADLFVSIHVNSSRGRNARGAETFFLASQARDEESRTLAAMENNAAGVDPSSIGQDSGDLAMVLWDLAQTRYLEESSDLAEVIQNELNAELDLRNRGIKQAPFRVLMGATMPAVLVEIGFITNPSEETALKTDEYRDRIAQALARAVLAFRAAPKARASTNR